MKEGIRQILLVFTVMLMATISCQALVGDDGSSKQVTTTQESFSSLTEEPSEQTTSDLNSPFPLPPDVEQFQTLGEEHINFQTSMSVDEIIAFYRDELSAQDLTERELLTVISENSFSMVFDGSENGKAMVIQGTLLKPGSLNINIRYEDV
jgi:hypothetical protein